MTLYSRRDKVPLTPHGAVLRVEGIEEAKRVFDTLEQKIQRRVLSAACRAGGKELLKRAKAEAPKRTGMFVKQLRQSTRFDRWTGTVTAKIWPKPTNMQRARGHVHRGSVVHLIVEGTEPHVIPGPVVFNGIVRENIQHPGSRPNPFIDRAAKAGEVPSVRAFEKRFVSKLEQEKAKVRK